MDHSVKVGICPLNVQVHATQEKNSRKLLVKLDRKLSTLPDIEDCGTCPESLSLYQTLWYYIKVLPLVPQWTAGHVCCVPRSPGTMSWVFRTSPESRRRSRLVWSELWPVWWSDLERTARTSTCSHRGQTKVSVRSVSHWFVVVEIRLQNEVVSSLIIRLNCSFVFTSLFEMLREWWMWAVSHSSIVLVDFNRSAAFTSFPSVFILGDIFIVVLLSVRQTLKKY